MNGAAGRLEVDYYAGEERVIRSIALLLSPHPRLGGTMHTPIVQHFFDICMQQGLAVLRFNYRGVGRSEGSFDNGHGEISDAAAALDWLQTNHHEYDQCWVFGYAFGAWVGMQLLMRRPEISHFVSVALPANIYDFTFLAPCPSSGLIVYGGSDKVAPVASARELSKRLKAQRGIEIIYKEIPGANHLFDQKTSAMIKTVNQYLAAQL